MSTLSKPVGVSILIACLVGVLYFAVRVWRDTNESAALSCLSSIAAATQRAVSTKGLEVEVGSSRNLSREEIELVLTDQKIGDCGGREHLLREVQIAIGEVNSNSSLPVRVWTNGSDEVPGTGDELVIPYGERVR